MSILAHVYNVIIYCIDGAPEHGREVFDGFNDTYKSFLSMSMTSVQLYGAEAYESQT